MSATTSVFNLTRFTALASGDVIAVVDVSDSTQSAHGSLDGILISNFFGTVPTPIVVTSADAAALAVGRQGSTTPAFQVDASTASQVAGFKVTGAATGGTVALIATDSGANTNLTLNAKGSGTIGIGSVSTGRVTITPVTTITGALTLSAVGLVYDGKTLTGSTGTGNMVLSAAPTLTGTITAAAANFSGDVTVATTKKLALNAGATSYLEETASNDVSLVINGLAVVRANSQITLTAQSGTWGFATAAAGGASTIGFFGATPQAKQDVTGSRSANAALASLLTALATYGIITNSTTG